ncbi:unnamed protein product [Rangifer tarandus platyrhynchus]|uniref:Uncharacterized protein n=1 Tax=Rangifer tarandus platyrhynchus TaxID=3082113 RepID=A0ABN9A1I4_RANTA|nr:unnamed protein product [Rangifer tarandus platyrhynchus]
MASTSLGREHTQVWLVDQLRSFSSHSPSYLPDTGHTYFFFFFFLVHLTVQIRKLGKVSLHILGFSLPSHASPRPVSPPHSPHHICSSTVYAAVPLEDADNMGLLES